MGTKLDSSREGNHGLSEYCSCSCNGTQTRPIHYLVQCGVRKSTPQCVLDVLRWPRLKIALGYSVCGPFSTIQVLCVQTSGSVPFRTTLKTCNNFVSHFLPHASIQRDFNPAKMRSEPFRCGVIENEGRWLLGGRYSLDMSSVFRRLAPSVSYCHWENVGA